MHGNRRVDGPGDGSPRVPPSDEVAHVALEQWAGLEIIALQDPAGFIDRTLSQIWNRKQIGRVYDVYQHNARIHTPRGSLYGREEAIRCATLALAAFPDLCHETHDVIWNQGLRDLSRVAVRWTVAGNNTGHSVYGPPTGRRVTLEGISHFRWNADRIIEHWVVYDELTLLQQLGIEPAQFIAEQADRAPFEVQPWGEVERLPGQGAPAAMPPTTAEGFDVEEFVRRGMHDIWNRRLLGFVEALYEEDAAFHGLPGADLGDRAEFVAHVLTLLAAFPDLAVSVDDLLWTHDGEGQYRTSTRWTLLGTHRGPGPYGAPSGSRVRVTGITNTLIQEGRIVEVWDQLPQLALLRQTHTPDREATDRPRTAAPDAAAQDVEEDNHDGARDDGRDQPDRG